eukprot:3469083-Amphidinium_carterae.1
MFDTKARVVFTSAAEANEKSGLVREKKPTDRGCKIFANRAQTAERQKGDYVLRRCRDAFVEIAPEVDRAQVRLAYGSKVLFYEMRVVAFLRGSELQKGEGWRNSWDFAKFASATRDIRCL